LHFGSLRSARCTFNLKQQNPDKMPAATWLEIIRSIESQLHFHRAVSEYECLAETYPAEKQSLLPLLAAGRLCLKKLNRPEEALKFYKAAAASKVPHLDWEANIQAGLQDAERALSSVPAGGAPLRSCPSNH
jgi:hypothetical protein